MHTQPNGRTAVVLRGNQKEKSAFFLCLLVDVVAPQVSSFGVPTEVGSISLEIKVHIRALAVVHFSRPRCPNMRRWKVEEMLAKEAARRRENPTPSEAAEAALESIVTMIEARVAAIDPREPSPP